MNSGGSNIAGTLFFIFKKKKKNENENEHTQSNLKYVHFLDIYQ